MSHAYDSDDGRHSPGLEPSKPNYGIEEQPPPFFRPSPDKGTSSDSSRKSQPNPGSGAAHGSAVLISHIDQNRPDLVAYELNHPIRRDSTPEDRDFAAPAQDTAKKVLQLLQNEPSAPKDNAPKNDFLNPAKDLRNDQGPPQLPRPLPSMASMRREPFKQFAGPDLLPAIHQPPATYPRPSENQHSLPPIQSALGEFSHVPPKDTRVNSVPYQLPPVAAPSPRNDLAREHHFPGPPQAPLSPYSHLSPASSKDISTVPSPISQPSYKKSHKSTIHYVTSPNEIPPQAAKSPITCYPTPTDPPTVGSLERPYGDLNTPLSGTVVTGSFRCNYPGCIAAPFPTQYLLNSHANVHSQERPHYCPVEGCSRGPGGRGFKRKNEMIRHGLVHNSPGYICPFCPGQQHKYPRPDNLQRHVRVHHVDKQKEDPELRRVLSQRPEGSTRGRRRKIDAS